MKKMLFICLMATLIIGCKEQSAKVPDKNAVEVPARQNTPTLKPEQFIGEWRNVSMEITTALNTASSEVKTYSEADWEAQLKMKPIRTYYKADGTYYSEYRDLRDKIFNRPSGTWHVSQDSVYLNQAEPEKRNAGYLVTFNTDNSATFKAMLDWTQNGKKDDLYIGVQRKVE